MLNKLFVHYKARMNNNGEKTPRLGDEDRRLMNYRTWSRDSWWFVRKVTTDQEPGIEVRREL